MNSSVGDRGRKPLHLRVTAAAERAVRAGHPWVFSESILSQNAPGESGNLAAIYDRKNRFLALGLFDPHSPLRVRILQQGKPALLDVNWWRHRLRSAVDKRAGMFGDDTTGYRLIHGESDGWPALVLDRYADTLVLKCYSSAWLPRLPSLLPLLRQEIPHQRLVLRLSRNIQKPARQYANLTDAAILNGSPIEEPVVFFENGFRFEADVLRGQKTGFFLDQRENRGQAASLAKGRRVLNAFSYSGGFSIYAAGGGARSVTDLDISPHALESARRNFVLNQNIDPLRSCPHEQIQADAFAWLENKGRAQFDMVIVDPPSLARKATDRAGAMLAYDRLVSRALWRLRPKGILLACSCSAHVAADDYFRLVCQAATRSRRPWNEMRRTQHPADHPAGFPEAAYLKGIYLHFRD